jgi:hypothetical protein
VHKWLLIAALAGALAVPAVAAAGAKPPDPRVICGTACDGGGGGYTGCTSASTDAWAGIPYISNYHHHLIVNYCKRNGIITSLSLVHYCTVDGPIVCNTGPAWLTGGGVGYGYATAHGVATYIGALYGVPWAGTSNADVTVSWG